MIKTHWGTVIAEQHERIVHGGRGDYVEIAEEHIDRTLLAIPRNAEWRLTPEWADRVFYIEHRKVIFGPTTHHLATLCLDVSVAYILNPLDLDAGYLQGDAAGPAGHVD